MILVGEVDGDEVAKREGRIKLEHEVDRGALLKWEIGRHPTNADHRTIGIDDGLCGPSRRALDGLSARPGWVLLGEVDFHVVDDAIQLVDQDVNHDVHHAAICGEGGTDTGEH